MTDAAKIPVSTFLMRQNVINSHHFSRLSSRYLPYVFPLTGVDSSLYLEPMNTPIDLITLEEARKLLEVSTKKLAALVRDGYLKEYKSPLDGRKKRMSRAEVEQLRSLWSEKAA